MEKTNSTKKTINKTKNTPKTAKTKVNYKEKFLAAEKEIKNLNTKITLLELENQKNINDFLKKAKGFSEKAQLEINKHKEELNMQLEKETLHIKKYGSQKMLESILEPVNNIELAVHAGKSNEAVKGYVTGFEMLLNQFYQELSMYGLIKIEPKVGKDFDPELHHAISTVNDKKNKNKIIEIKKIGFKFHDRIIKPATVIIGK